MGLLDGKTAIVTGAARGIGKAIALKLSLIHICGVSLNTAAVKNKTMIAKLSGFDYDNATVTSIAVSYTHLLLPKESWECGLQKGENSSYMIRIHVP